MSTMTADELRAWSQEVDESLIDQATDVPACWGGQFRVSDMGLYVTEDVMDEVLPAGSSLNLYYCCAAADSGLSGVTYEAIAEHMDSGEWLCKTADRYVDSDQCIVFYTEYFPEDFDSQEMAELAETRPDLFEPEDIECFPELAPYAEQARGEVTEAAAIDDTPSLEPETAHGDMER